MFTEQINNTRAAALRLEDMACAAPNKQDAIGTADRMLKTTAEET